MDDRSIQDVDPIPQIQRPEIKVPLLHVDYFDQHHNPTHPDVLTWQKQMEWRGWNIQTDQIYGPQSEEICRQFQTIKVLTCDGMVGPVTWDSSWSTPVDQLEIYAQAETEASDEDEHPNS